MNIFGWLGWAVDLVISWLIAWNIGCAHGFKKCSEIHEAFRKEMEELEKP